MVGQGGHWYIVRAVIRLCSQMPTWVIQGRKERQQAGDFLELERIILHGHLKEGSSLQSCYSYSK